MGIENMNANHKKNLVGKIRGRIMHLTMHVPNVTSLDIKARIVGIKYIQNSRQKKKEMWTFIKLGMK